jgi:hypothetical protein
MSNIVKTTRATPGHGPGSQVGGSSRQIAAARHGVSPADVKMAEPSNLNTAEAQRAAIAAANSGVIQASPSDMPPPAER